MSSSKLKIPVSKEDHSQGAETAQLVLVKYGDYQCPYCGQAYPIVKRLQKALGNRLKFVFRNFPLSGPHVHALGAARVAEAAAMQGKFWEMHDMLYENQENLDDGSLRRYAERLKLDVRELNLAVGGPEIEKRIAADFKGGVGSGVNGTPAFFVNGVRYDGNWNYTPFLSALESMLAAAD